MALGCKYVSFLVFLPPYLLFTSITFWKKIIPHSTKIIPLWLLAIALPISPWLIYNLIWTGNPIYPLLPSVFGFNIPSAETAYEFIRNHAPQPVHLTVFALPGYIIRRINGLLLDGNALTLIGIIALATSSWWRKQSIGESIPSFAVRGLLAYIVLSSVLFMLGSDNVDGRFFCIHVDAFIDTGYFFLILNQLLHPSIQSLGKIRYSRIRVDSFCKRRNLSIRSNQGTSGISDSHPDRLAEGPLAKPSLHLLQSRSVGE